MVECNICHWTGENFLDFDCGYGRIYPKAVCLSHPRHRSMILYLAEVLPTDRRLRLLHFAPEKVLSAFLRTYGNINYLSADIDPKRALVAEDITRLSFADRSFDAILCMHVLEHIGDDRKAMRELRRVLRPGGFAILDVPIDYTRKNTYEDPAIASPEERTRAYWQHDHVRLYGMDFPERLAEAGFLVSQDDYIKKLPKKTIRRHGLQDTLIYVGAR